MSDELSVHLAELAALLAQATCVASPYDAQIHALEVAKADALNELTWAIETVKSVVRPLILAEQRTVKMHGLTASYVHKESWNSERLHEFAGEVPAILQALQDASYVIFRYRTNV